MVVDFDKSYIPGYFDSVDPNAIEARDSFGGYGVITLEGKFPHGAVPIKGLSGSERLKIIAKFETALKVVKNKVKDEGCSIRGLFEKIEMYAQFLVIKGLVEQNEKITDTRCKQADVISDYIYEKYGGLTLSVFYKSA